MAFELIEASAGTGKTYSITSRYLLLLIEQGLQIGQILVVTFTEAATAELRDRVRSRVRDVRDAVASNTLDTLEDKELLARLKEVLKTDDDLKQAEKRLANALVAFDEAAIFTIHGFCRRVLREEAFASGMDFAAEVLTDDLPVLESVTADFARSCFGQLSSEEYGWCVEHSPFLDGASETDWRVTGRVMTTGQLKKLREIISNPLIDVVPERIPMAEARKTKDPEAVALAMTHDLIAYGRDRFARRKRELRVISFGDMLLHVHKALEGPGGKRLAETLHDTFRAALIDEFQDTDPLQYDIFRRIYHGTDCPVVFVGDPKQAIYSFRGGDVFAYFGATGSIPEKDKKTLTGNYRSATDLVTAVTQLFTFRDKKFPFFDGGKTGFPKVTAFHEKGKDAVVLPRIAGRSAFHWFLIPEVQHSAAENSPAYGWRKDDAAAIAVKAVADEIALLVPHTEPGPGELTHGDIAVLVRTHVQATTVQTALQSAGIPSIIKAMGNVFGSDSARELLTLLRAIVSPGNESLLSTALISESIGHTAAGLVAIKDNTATYAKIAQPFFDLREIWEKAANGFIRMAMDLLYNRGLAADGKSIAEHLLVYTDAERRLTDMLHLIELVHQESILHPGTDHLLRWLEEQIADAAADSEEASIRLESDAKRVQIVTIHSSKGLEYPVVFCPFVWEGKMTRNEWKERSVVFFHQEGADEAHRADVMPVLTADIGSPEQDQHFERMKQEKQSEAIRMLYVALTRARQRCYVVWGQVNQMQHAALTWLLFGDRCSKSSPIRELSYQDIVRPVKDLKKLCGKAMATSMLDADAVDIEPKHPGRVAPTDSRYGPREFTRGAVAPSWSFASYTSLTNEWITSGRDVDASTEGSVIPPAEEWSIFSFPAGARTGKMWHQLFERLDFQGTPGQIDAFVETTLRRNGFQSEFAPALSRMVSTTLDASLDPPHFALRSVQSQSCVRELDFVYHVDRFAISQVRSILQNPAFGLPEAFYDAAARLKEKDVQGFMIGTIDLLAESDGKYYLLDYKSNHLGNSFERYAAPMLVNVMAEGHYYLQYLIYTIAVHRYLRARVPGYSYETHFGGVFYLFLRGIRPRDQSGVFYNRPPLELIQVLESFLMEGGRG